MQMFEGRSELLEATESGDRGRTVVAEWCLAVYMRFSVSLVDVCLARVYTV